MEKSKCCGAESKPNMTTNLSKGWLCSKCGKSFESQPSQKSWKDSPETDIRVEDPQNLSKGDKERTHIRTSLTYGLPAGINDDEWEVIINNVESLASQSYDKGQEEERERIVKEINAMPSKIGHYREMIDKDLLKDIITNQ